MPRAESVRIPLTTPFGSARSDTWAAIAQGWLGLKHPNAISSIIGFAFSLDKSIEDLILAFSALTESRII